MDVNCNSKKLPYSEVLLLCFEKWFKSDCGLFYFPLGAPRVVCMRAKIISEICLVQF